MLTFLRVLTKTSMHLSLGRIVIRMIAYATAFASLTLFSGRALAQQISYILPDIGTPGMATYIEGIGPADAIGNFGSDGLYLNNAESEVRLECVNSGDTHRIIIGPVVVGWGGRMFSSHIFVAPFVTAQSHDWSKAPADDVIPLRFVKNGAASNPVLFRIVRPSPSITLAGEAVLGENGNGIRSPRGAMIFESLTLDRARLRVSTQDCDTAMPGNQGYLPAVVLLRGQLKGDGHSSLIVSAREAAGGPGGGGGAGSFCVGDSVGMQAGSGFSAGGSGGRNAGGVPSLDDRYTGHAQGSGMAVDSSGASLNGRSPGLPNGFYNAAGGTGHPFGDSGIACAVVVGCGTPGGRGGGSGAGTGEGAGGGGNASDGAPRDRPQRGLTHGNRQIVPLAGGSGGASGTPTQLLHCSGRGGGGGGALRLFASNIEGISVISDGASGGIGVAFADGGSGSGGCLILASKLASSVETISVLNGSASASEGIGRLRLDGGIEFSDIRPAAADVYFGPATDTTSFIKRSSILLSGRGDGNRIRLYLKSVGAPWTQIATVLDYQDTRWSITLELPGNEQLYYLVAVQENPTPSADWYLYAPRFVMSQAGYNLFRNSEAGGKLAAPGELVLSGLPCGSERRDTVMLQNNSSSSLTIRSVSFTDPATRFSLPGVPTVPFVIRAGSTLPLILASSSSGLHAGDYRDTLRLLTDDMTLHAQRHDMPLLMQIDSFGVDVDGKEVGFGTIDLCGSRSGKADIYIRNTGSADIFVDAPITDDKDVNVLNPDPSAFPLRLPPGQTTAIQLKCEPAFDRGSLAGEITLRASMQDCEKDLRLSYTATTDSAWLAGDALLDFGALNPSQFPRVRGIVIVNPSTRPIELLKASFPAGSPYRVLSGERQILAPFESARLEIECSDPRVPGLISEQLSVETDPACAEHTVLVTTERLPAAMTIAVGDVSGKAGDTVFVHITVNLSGAGTLEQTVSVQTTLQMNASLLVPVGSPIGSVRDGMRSVPLRIEVPSGTARASITLPFFATLGDSEETPLEPTATRIDRMDVELFERTGHFTLLGVCRDGGSRLFDGRIRAGIVSVLPHPLRGVSDVTCRAIEHGVHQVAVHDALGRRLRVLHEAEQFPGEFSITIGTPGFRPGLHFIVLTTPSAQYVKPLLISQ